MGAALLCVVLVWENWLTPVLCKSRKVALHSRLQNVAVNTDSVVKILTSVTAPPTSQVHVWNTLLLKCTCGMLFFCVAAVKVLSNFYCQENSG